MPLKINLSDTVRVKVAGTLAGPEGPEPFDFTFTARRMAADELERATRRDDGTVGDFLAGVISNWAGVRGDQGDVPYSRDALDSLCNSIPGLAGMMFEQYVIDCGARRKN